MPGLAMNDLPVISSKKSARIAPTTSLPDPWPQGRTHRWPTSPHDEQDDGPLDERHARHVRHGR
jgi:antitoxin (DNA-binding transcriptional repressor) of toxin-antitoxin stability system